MKILPELALTYDDVLLVPQYSEVSSRRTLSTDTQFTTGIELKIPIISANMDTVTESEMGIALAHAGGIGIIHRFLSIEDQVCQVRKIKKSESYIVDNPISVQETNTVGEVNRIIAETYTGGIMIIDEIGKVVGIVTSRDLLFDPGCDHRPAGHHPA